jgi:hypothetical protein
MLSYMMGRLKLRWFSAKESGQDPMVVVVVYDLADQKHPAFRKV